MAQLIPVVFPNYNTGFKLVAPLGHAGVLLINDGGDASYHECRELPPSGPRKRSA